MATKKMVVINEYDHCIKCRGCVVSCQRNFVNSSLGKSLVPGTGGGIGVTPLADRIATDDATVVKPQFGWDYPPFLKYNCWHCATPPCAGRCPFKAISKNSDGSVSIDFSLCKPTQCNQECTKDCGNGGFPKVGQGNGTDLKAYKCDMCYGRRIPLLVNNGGTVAGNPDVIDIKTFGNFRDEAKSKIGTTDTASIDVYKVSACVLACPTGALKMGYLDDLDAYLAQLKSDALAKGKTLYVHHGPGDSWAWAGTLMSAPPKSDPMLDDHLVPLTRQMVDGKLVPVGLMVGGLYLLYKRRQELAAAEK